MYFYYKGQSIFAFSDTHGMHRGLRIPSNIEILICAGDVITDFSEEGLKDFLNWYSNVPELTERLDMNKWKRIYQSIQCIQEEPSDYYIKLVCRWESCSPMIDMNCSVYTRTDHQLVCTMAEYHSWAEILGMDIQIDDDVEITAQELTAGLLWEITYYGGT